jgi:hypothetical protein
MSDEIRELKARLARLEAKEACMSRFNEYLYSMDRERPEDVINVFTPDAELDVINFPPGSGQNLKFRGRAEIEPLYSSMTGIPHRHHTANVSVNVTKDGNTAELSAYLFTVLKYILTGGMYEAKFKLAEGGWYISYMRITSTWGWTVPGDMPPFLDELFGAGTLREGRPVKYE